MVQQSHASQRSRRKASPQESPPEQPQPTFSTRQFPIRFMDVVLVDLQIQRFPENAQPYDVPAGSLNVEVQRPLIIGTRLDVGLLLRAAVPSEEAPAFRVAATLNGVFETDENADRDLIMTFSQSTAPLLIWPYARELVQSLTVRMRVIPVVLPTLDRRPDSPAVAEPGQESDVADRAPDAGAE